MSEPANDRTSFELLRKEDGVWLEHPEWGLVNRCVPDSELDKATCELLDRATQGSRASKAIGKQALYAQLDRPERDAYTYAVTTTAGDNSRFGIPQTT